MDNFYAKYPVTGGGVTSLNGETGAITLVAGTNITITPAGQNITIASTGLGTALTNAHIFVGNASNQATDVPVSGDLTLVNTGAFTIANLAVTNAKIANATIDLTTKVTNILPIANGGTGSATTSQNFAFIGPTSGSGAPSFRALVAGDIPSLAYANQSLSNLTNPTAINQDLIFNKTSPIIQTIDNVGNDQFTIKTGQIAAVSSDKSSDLEVATGDVTDPGSTGRTGDLELFTGSNSGDGRSGEIDIITGSISSSSNRSSGLIGIGTGDTSGDTSGTSGTLSLFTGSQTGASATGGTGGLDIMTGLVTSGSGATGDLTAETGSNSATGNTGSITYTTGDAASGSSGGVALVIGSASAVRGKIKFVDGSEGAAGQVWTSTDTLGNGHWATVVAAAVNNKETFILSGTNITNQFIDLAHVASTNSINFMVQGSGSLLEGVSYDYSVNYTGGSGGNTRITFLNDLATGGGAALIAGDVVQVQYEY